MTEANSLVRLVRSEGLPVSEPTPRPEGKERLEGAVSRAVEKTLERPTNEEILVRKVRDLTEAVERLERENANLAKRLEALERPKIALPREKAPDSDSNPETLSSPRSRKKKDAADARPKKDGVPKKPRVRPKVSKKRPDSPEAPVSASGLLNEGGLRRWAIEGYEDPATGERRFGKDVLLSALFGKTGFWQDLFAYANALDGATVEAIGGRIPNDRANFNYRIKRAGFDRISPKNVCVWLGALSNEEAELVDDSGTLSLAGLRKWRYEGRPGDGGNGPTGADVFEAAYRSGNFWKEILRYAEDWNSNEKKIWGRFPDSRFAFGKRVKDSPDVTVEELFEALEIDLPEEGRNMNTKGYLSDAGLRKWCHEGYRNGEGETVFGKDVLLDAFFSGTFWKVFREYVANLDEAVFDVLWGRISPNESGYSARLKAAGFEKVSPKNLCLWLGALSNEEAELSDESGYLSEAGLRKWCHEGYRDDEGKTVFGRDALRKFAEGPGFWERFEKYASDLSSTETRRMGGKMPRFSKSLGERLIGKEISIPELFEKLEIGAPEDEVAVALKRWVREESFVDGLTGKRFFGKDAVLSLFFGPESFWKAFAEFVENPESPLRDLGTKLSPDPLYYQRRMRNAGFAKTEPRDFCVWIGALASEEAELCDDLGNLSLAGLRNWCHEGYQTPEGRRVFGRKILESAYVSGSFWRELKEYGTSVADLSNRFGGRFPSSRSLMARCVTGNPDTTVEEIFEALGLPLPDDSERKDARGYLSDAGLRKWCHEGYLDPFSRKRVFGKDVLLDALFSRSFRKTFEDYATSLPDRTIAAIGGKISPSLFNRQEDLEEAGLSRGSGKSVCVWLGALDEREAALCDDLGFLTGEGLRRWCHEGYVDSKGKSVLGKDVLRWCLSNGSFWGALERYAAGLSSAERRSVGGKFPRHRKSLGERLIGREPSIPEFFEALGVPLPSPEEIENGLSFESGFEGAKSEALPDSIPRLVRGKIRSAVRALLEIGDPEGTNRLGRAAFWVREEGDKIVVGCFDRRLLERIRSTRTYVDETLFLEISEGSEREIVFDWRS